MSPMCMSDGFPRLARLALCTASLAVMACAAQEAERSEAGVTEAFAPRWVVQYEDSTSLFIGLSIVDAQTVWITGQPGTVGRTLDGGESWSVGQVPGAETMAFRDVHAFTADEALLLSIGNGEASSIYRTDDGGDTWAPVFVNRDPNAFYDCFSFWDRQRGFAFSDSHEGEFSILATGDGGLTWSRIDPTLVPDARPGEGAFAASGTCTATGPDGLGWFVTGASGVDTRIIRTTDYGATWSEAPTPVPSTQGDEGLASVAFLDGRVGAAFGTAHADGETNVAVTSDGGVTWRRGGRVLDGLVYGGAAVPGAATPSFVVVSPNGSAYSTDQGATWTDIDAINYWTVSFLNANVGWAAGRGRISRVTGGPPQG